VKVLLFGATGMVGQGVLLECLDDPRVEQVLAVVRSPLAQQHGKLRELRQSDFYDWSKVESELSGWDACFFCLGVSSAGMKEPEYTRMTYDLTLSAATTLSRLNPKMTFIYVSGAGTDGSEKGRSMWGRVKGRTENAILALPFSAAFMFRPGYIQPMRGIRSKTPIYQAAYNTTGWMYPIFKKIAPKWVTSSDRVGKAMIRVAAEGFRKKHLENADINELAGG
jgi:uncharacterized protein YbjT (DUF2867 family)